MKRLAAASSLLLLLLSACLYNGHYLQNLSCDLTLELSRSHAAAQNGDWTTALAQTQSAYQRWQDHHFYLHAVLRHSDTDQIFRTFQAVLQYLDIREWDQYTAANADLMAQIALLAETEQASLSNVL